MCGQRLGHQGDLLCQDHGGGVQVRLSFYLPTFYSRDSGVTRAGSTQPGSEGLRISADQQGGEKRIQDHVASGHDALGLRVRVMLSLSSCVRRQTLIHRDKIHIYTQLKIPLAKNTSGSNFASCPSCGSSGQPAEYIPLWPALSWLTELMTTRDKPCAKLVRSKIRHKR